MPRKSLPPPPPAPPDTPSETPRTALREALGLIGRLADAAGTGHTRTAIARRLAEALAEATPLHELMLGRVASATSTPRDDGLLPAVADTVLCQPLGPEDLLVAEGLHPIAGSALAALLDSEREVVRVLDADTRPWPAFPDVHRAFAELGATRLVLMRLCEPDDDPQAFATFALGSATSQAFLEPIVLESVARVLTVALRNAGLIERVATLSRRAHRENQQLRQQLQQLELPERLVARSEVMRRVLARVELVAAHPTTVLLRGESGTGKELVARRIHRLSSRASRPFLKVNCGAIPLELVESELFGHEKGSFTGAAARHVGLFERADGGTLLLDEIGELPLAAQVKLLRVLQEGCFERVGGEQTVRVDVRLLAATHRHLEAMVEAGQFRADLYYRLNVFPIEIPPLRARQDDIHGLAEVLLGEIGRRLGRAHEPVRLTPEALARLRHQSWPGNVRELENVLERAVILSPGATLQLPEALELGVTAPGSAGSPATPAQPVPQGEAAAVVSLAQATREAIERALRHTQGRIYGAGGAAELLGVKPSTLQSKMVKLGIRRR